MGWLVVLIYIGIFYYTLKLGIETWKKGNRFAGFSIILMALSILFLSIWQKINDKF